MPATRQIGVSAVSHVTGIHQAGLMMQVSVGYKCCTVDDCISRSAPSEAGNQWPLVMDKDWRSRWPRRCRQTRLAHTSNSETPFGAFSAWT